MAKRAFGELESHILYLLKSGERKTVKEIHQALGGQDNYNTIMTVMVRLTEKKMLGREKIGLQYEYWILSSKPEISFLEKLKNKVFGEKPAVLMSYLLESTDNLTEEDLTEMEALIQKKRETK